MAGKRTAITVEGIDNRSIWKDAPFGFVYLLRGGEPAGRIGFGANRDNRDVLAVWPTKATPPMTPPELDAVKRALEERFPECVGKQAAPEEV